MHRVLVVGAGNIGSRHVQALARVGGPLAITVVDPIADSLELTRSRIADSPAAENGHEFEFSNELPRHVQEIDVAIIATTAAVRRQVVEDLLGTCNVRAVVLEKVLFQRIEDYQAVERLLHRHSVPAWVNCPRRLQPIYRNLKARLSGQQRLFYTCSGGNWGMASNAIHLVDHLCFLSGERDFRFSTAFLDPGHIETKRPGFKEVTGTLIGGSRGGSSIVLQSMRDATAPSTIEIVAREETFVIEESRGVLLVFSNQDGQEVERQEFRIAPQSQLTNVVIEDLLATGSCGLTPFSESVALHLPLLQALAAHFSDGTRSGVVPIT